MSELPVGWTKCAMGDIAKIVGGATPDSNDPTNFIEEGGMPWLTPADLSGYTEMYISRGKRNITEKGYQSCSTRLIPQNTVLFSSRAPIGYVAIASNNMCTSQGFKSFIPYGSINSKYLYYYLKFAKNDIEQLGTGSTFREISGKKAERIPFILAPENEQKRIAEKLDKIFAELDSIKARLDKFPIITKTFRMSVLDKAIKEKNGSSNTSIPWNTKKLGEIIEVIEAGKNIKCAEYPPQKGEYGIVKISSVTWGCFNEEESKTLYKKALFLENRKIKKGDFLISRANTLELVGAPVIVEKITKDLMLSDKVLRLAMPENMKKWVMYVLKSNYGRKQIEARASGNQQSMRNISQKSLAEIPIPCAGPKQISSIVEHIEDFMVLSEKIEERYELAIMQIQKIKESILNKAFSGGLVPQNPNDEHASFLLERIKEEKLRQAPIPKKEPSTIKNNKEIKRMILPILDTLQKEKGPLSAQDLLEKSGYPHDSDPETIERFFLDIKKCLIEGTVVCERTQDEDVFKLVA